MKKTSNKKVGYCTFYIVRHGETEWNVVHRLQGQENSPLTKNGIKQAKDLAKIFSEIKFAEVFSSDLGRAHQTAEVIALEQQIAVKTTQLLRERRFGKFTGMKSDQFRNELKGLLEKREELTEEDQLDFRIDDDIETMAEVSSRAITFLRETAMAYPEKKVMVVTHGGVIRDLLVRLGFGTSKEISYDAISNLGYFVLESDGVDFFIKETHGIIKIDIPDKKD
jgi:phosphoserine phosphatase